VDNGLACGDEVGARGEPGDRGFAGASLQGVESMCWGRHKFFRAGLVNIGAGGGNQGGWFWPGERGNREGVGGGCRRGVPKGGAPPLGSGFGPKPGVGIGG